MIHFWLTEKFIKTDSEIAEQWTLTYHSQKQIYNDLFQKQALWLIKLVDKTFFTFFAESIWATEEN